MDIYAIKNLYAYEDGDTVTPDMGLQIADGHGLQQYYDPTTFAVKETDFSQFPAVLFPQAYSSKLGRIIVPETEGQQWYYNNITDAAGILDSQGNVKTAFQDRFEKTTVTLNGATFPALRIKGNLVGPTRTDVTDKRIYYVSSYRGMQITCQKTIPIMSSVGDAYDVLLSCVGQNGSGDNVLSSDNDWVQFSSYLQLAGSTVQGATAQFQRLVNGAWQNLTNQTGVCEISGNVIKLFDAAVNGSEMFRCVMTYSGKTYQKTFEVTDIHDPLYVVDGCSILGDTIAPGERATFSPKVYRRDNGEEVSGFSFSYVITKRSDGTVVTDFDITAVTYDNVVSVDGVLIRTHAHKD